MRLFIAIDLSPDMKKTLVGFMHDLKQKGLKGNYTPAQNLHLTLCFIGETKRAEEVKEAMRAVSYKEFRLSLDETGRFGDILWVGLKGSQKMKVLTADLRKQLDLADIPYDRKPFEPHITLIRKVSGRIPGRIAAPKAEMMVKKVSLMKSEQKDGRMVYTEIFSV